MRISELHRESARLLDDWHTKITVQQLIQCPAIAVRSLVYEQLGGFLPQFHYIPDWEMWQRVASQFSITTFVVAWMHMDATHQRWFNCERNWFRFLPARL